MKPDIYAGGGGKCRSCDADDRMVGSAFCEECDDHVAWLTSLTGETHVIIKGTK